ncbi:MAG: calcium-binding protein [Candidatus Gastranaerophilaceae bacterium]
MTGGLGNDNLFDNQGGDDTYIYNLGDGYDFITDFGGNDTIRFGEGITASNLRMNRQDNGNLEIYFDGLEGNIIISDYFNNNENKIEKIVLADNTVITDFSQFLPFVETSESYTITEVSLVQDIQATGTADITLIGDSKNNTISGNSGNNTFEGKAGNDRLIDSEGGNDTYIYNLGDGDDTINDIGGIDTLKFGAGISIEDLEFMQAGNNLNMWFKERDGGIIIENYFSNPENKIERFEFADGTVITDISNYIVSIGSEENIVLPDGILQAHLWGTGDISATGNSLDNWFGGNSGNNTFEGKGGNDYFWDDQGGDDTYIYNLGDGYDVIHDENGSDTIQFGQDISASDLSFVHPTDSNNLEVLIGESGKITIENYFSSDVYKIETFKFADNSLLTDISSLITEINYSQTQSIVDETEALGEFDVNQLIQEINSYGVNNDVVMTNSQNQNDDLLLVMGN